MTQIDALYELGTSTWLDDLSRDRIKSGNLREVIDTKSIVGVTTNPSIFASAMTQGTAYDEQITQLKAAGSSVDDAVYAMTIDDVRDACDIFTDIYERTGGRDGRVSIEVDPRFSADHAATITQAQELWDKVDRPNVMIKIPATDESLPAISDALAAGISVNVTLIFSVGRYQQVIDAFQEGIRRAAANGHDVSAIHSVASFFVSRMDTEVDNRLEAIGSEEALALRGKAGVANARLAYGLFRTEFTRDDLPEGANPQRPLWASTGVKNPDYPDTMYVADLVTENVVNTMPEATLLASADHLEVKGDTVSTMYEDAHKVMDDLAAVGVDFADVAQLLEDEGVVKFEQSWEELLESVTTALNG